MSDGTWILLENCQYTPHVLVQIESILNESSVNPGFRCWLSMMQTDNSWSEIPSSLFVNSIRGLVCTPTTMKENMIRSFACINQETLRLSSKPEWQPLLHNLAYLHASLKLRARYSKCGWNVPSSYLQELRAEEFINALKAASQEFALGEQQQPQQVVRTESAKSGSENGRFSSCSAIKFVISDVSAF